MAHVSLSRLDHRPWALPAGRWVWRQSWCDLLFAHWPVPAAVLRPLVPAALDVQEFDGTSWIGLVPFRMEGVSLRPFPDLPWLSAFPEVNVRLYVEHQGQAGVWFLSLDAPRLLAVWAARLLFHLPYFHAAISVERAGEAEGEPVSYRMRRHRAGATFTGRYAPTSPVYEATAGSLEHWLTERYCLYAERPDGGIECTDVHHLPWPLQRAEAEFDDLGLLQAAGVAVAGPPALLHFSRRVDVVMWSPQRV